MIKPEKIEQDVRELEGKIGVPEKFIFNLLTSGSDWLFVIILHSFLEATLTQLIIKALGKNELENIINRLEMINKVEYAKSLSLLSKEARRFIYKLSEIRNIFVHNIESISINLRQYVKDLNSDQLKNFIKATKYGINEQFEINGTKVEREVFIKDNPRIAMWMSAHAVIAEMSMAIGIELKKQNIEKLQIQIAETFFPSQKTTNS